MKENKTLNDFERYFVQGHNYSAMFIKGKIKRLLKAEAIKWIKSKSNIIKPVFGEKGRIIWAVMPRDEIKNPIEMFNISEMKGVIEEKIRFFNITEEDLNERNKRNGKNNRRSKGI